MDKKQWGIVSYGDTTVTIYAEEVSEETSPGVFDTKVVFTLEVNQINGVPTGDLLGFFIDFKDGEEPAWSTLSGEDVLAFRAGNDNVLWVGSKANNMNGLAINAEEGAVANDAYDVGVQLSSTGTSGGNVGTTTFTINGISLADIDGQRFGLRLQNTLNPEGSLKLEGIFEDPPAPFSYQGYTRGKWGQQFSDLIDGLVGSDTFDQPITFEGWLYGQDTGLIFTDPSDNGGPDAKTKPPTVFDNPTFQQIFTLGGGGLNQLAAQSSAAYLNALYFANDSDPITAYRFSENQIKDWTKIVIGELYDGEGVITIPTDGSNDRNGLLGVQWALDSNDDKIFGNDGDQWNTVSLGSTIALNDLKDIFDYYNHFSDGAIQPSATASPAMTMF